jgi:hypothetical protein
MRKLRLGLVFKVAGIALALLLAVGLAAPYISTSQYGERLRGSLERALDRRVEFRGKVHFSLFGGGFTVEDVFIHEDPSIGLEPIAHMDSISVRPAIWPLLGGRFVIASIRLDGASVNLAKTGPAAEWGRWNFASVVNRSVMRATPALHVRNGRINFKFGDLKTVFYLLDTDLDISPPSSPGRGWLLDCSAKAARTDRPAQGLGAFTLRGRWYVAPERVDLNLELDRAALEEITALFQGRTGGVHGSISSRLHLAGPLNQIGIVGRLRIEDVHRWDLLPSGGQGWPLDIRGRLDLVSQRLELESASAANLALPLWVRFRATDYLSQPHWAVALNWNRFPVAPLMQLAEHMGARFPNGVKLGGWIDGAIGYAGQGSLQGALAFHEASLAIPDSPPMRFEQAQVVLDHGHARLAPSLVRTGDGGEAQLEADYALDQDTLDLAISTEAMQVASLRAQVSLAAVPWLDQLRSGQWSGNLRYHHEPAKAGWTGVLQVSHAELAVPGLASPVELAAAHATIDGPRVVIDRLRARAGRLAFTGDYRYEPAAPRPHRLRLRAVQWDAADVEAECLPTLRHTGSLLARALGRASLPEWLKTRALEGAVQIDRLLVAGASLENVRARLLWDGARVEFPDLQARFDRATVSGRLAVNLGGSRPAYTLTGKLRGLDWQAGKLDAEGTLETSGTGSQLLANLTSDGTFAGAGLDFGSPGPFRTASGGYSLAFSQGIPRLKLIALNLRTEDESFTGHGSTQDDGRLLIVLTDGAREVRMSGLLGKLKLEETVR